MIPAQRAGAARRFSRLHRTSVLINGVQLLVVLIVLVGFLP